MTSLDQRGYITSAPHSHLLGRQFLLHLAPNECVIQLRKRVEIGRFLGVFLRLCRITLRLIGLAQAIKVSRIKLVRLLELCDSLVVVFLRERDPSCQLMNLPDLRRILLSLRTLAKFLGILFGGCNVFPCESKRGRTKPTLELRVVLNLLREPRCLDYLQ